MHENHQPSCLTCQFFNLPFQKESPLSEWGYCAKRKNSIPEREKLAAIEEEAKEGSYNALLDGSAGLYQGEDEWCPLYVEV